jgi:thiopurine S-methyltransferase
MQPDFWHERWQSNQIGFHLPEANPLLVKHFSALNLTPKIPQKTSPCIFLPLCGKTLDIAWLLTQGYQVIGAELSQIAVDELFSQLNLTPKITQKSDFTHFSSSNIDIFVGDIFNLTPEILGKVDAIYDRAALVALPNEMRKAYTAHLLALTNKAPQLLICFEYDQNLHAGPPFSISADEVRKHYQTQYDLTLLASETMADGLKGKFPATEQVWLLTPKS